MEWKPKKNDQAWLAPGDDTIRKTVWFDTGTTISKLADGVKTRGDRAKGVDLLGQAEVVALTNNLKSQHAGIVGTVGFYVAPRK